MVATTAQTYNDLVSATTKNYAESVPAMGLFYQNGANSRTGVRLECPGIRKEFCDQIPFGRDPEGTLFFDSVNDFPDNGQDSFYNVFHNTSTVATEKAVVVQFYTGTASQGPFYAEFVARDPVSTWNDLNIASVTSVIQKQTKAKEFTLTMNAISKKATFSLPPTLNLPNASVKAYGTTYFKGIKNIKDGSKTYIDYSNDRIVFFQGTDFAHANDAVAYFIRKAFFVILH
ncbi:hypothetical protein BJ912DRAFT_1001784 [Pholiota molesta]|nr:hypothetical protein BJ912DRAFT_1001784 [Pholiota molesta]